MQKIRVWDIWVRLFHWLLAAAVLFELFNGLSDIGFTLWHRKVGEFILLLLVFRWCLLFIGSSNLRLSALLRSPHSAVEHLVNLLDHKVDVERGHNAAGSWAVITLITLLSFQALSGMFIADDPDVPRVAGAWFDRVSKDTMETLRELHAINANILIALVILHIGMVLVYLLHAGLNLVRPMISGRMPWPDDRPVPEVRFLPFAAGLVLALAIGGSGAWLLGWF